MAKEYTYDLIDVSTEKPVYRDITRAEMLLVIGTNVNLSPCLRSGVLLQNKYLVKCRREFERLNTNNDNLFAELELECRKFRELKWSKTDGFNLAEAWRQWKEKLNG